MSSIFRSDFVRMLAQYLLISFVVISTFPAIAKKISPELAVERVRGVTTRALQNSHFSLNRTIVDSDGDEAVYVFSSPAHAIIISADDMAVPLLGIIDGGVIEVGNPEFDYWMVQYVSQIEWLRKNYVATRSDDSSEERSPIEPLVKTKWNQGSPYNMNTPLHDGKKSYTGCVATAVSQVMNYHKWPDRGIGSQSYRAEKINKDLSANFSTFVFDWDNMLSVYDSSSSQVANQAVGNLMYAVGIGVKMNYGSDSSGAYSELIPHALIDFFNYDKSAHICYRDYVTQSEWEDMIYDQLRNVGPLYYAGSSDTGAHAFVCDGYKDGLFHINWGWGGSNDGYYRLSALYPGAEQGIGGSEGAYNFGQCVIADVHRPSASSARVPVLVCPMGITAPDSFNKNSVVKFTGWVMNYSSSPVTAQLGLIIEDENGKVRNLPGNSSSTFKAEILGGTYTFTLTMPKDLEGDSWTVWPAYRVDGEDKWVKVPIANGFARYFTMTRSGNSYLLTPESPVSASLMNLEVCGRALQGKTIRFIARANNYNKSDYEGVVRAVVKNSSGEIVAHGIRTALNLKEGESNDWEYPTKLYKDYKELTNLAVGNYTVYIEDARNGNQLSRPIPMKYEVCGPTHLTVNKFTLANGIRNVDPDNVEFVTNLTCTSGYLSDRLTIGIWLTTDPMSHVKDIKTEEFILEERQTGEMRTLTRLENPVTTCDYIVGLYFEGQQIGKSLYFRVSTSGVEDMTVEEIVSAEVYNLSGLKVAENPHGSIDTMSLPTGIYIYIIKTRNGKRYSHQIAIK